MINSTNIDYSPQARILKQTLEEWSNFDEKPSCTKDDHVNEVLKQVSVQQLQETKNTMPSSRGWSTVADYNNALSN